MSNKNVLLIYSIIFFTSIQSKENTYNSITKPTTITFGKTVNEVKVSLKPYCSSISIREVKPAQIPNTKNRQMQLDCQGYIFAGKERLAEFVFKDDGLFLVWVLVNKEELAFLETKMISEYKTPQYKNALFSAFTHQKTALRKDVPEVLFYANQAADQFEMWFQSVR